MLVWSLKEKRGKWSHFFSGGGGGIFWLKWSYWPRLISVNEKKMLRLLIIFSGAFRKMFRMRVIFGEPMANGISVERLWNVESKYISKNLGNLWLWLARASRQTWYRRCSLHWITCLRIISYNKTNYTTYIKKHLIGYQRVSSFKDLSTVAPRYNEVSRYRKKMFVIAGSSSWRRPRYNELSG